MANRDIAQTTYGDLSSNLDDFSVAPSTTDGATEQKRTTWMNTKWKEYLGYYRKIPELKAAIDAKAKWTVGKGYTADEITTLILDRIRGFGKDTFNDILENLIRVYHIGGDSYAEIILDDEGYLINLKPLDPGSMRHIVNAQGIIIKYEQVSKISGKPVKTFEPEKIFHLSRDRLADEIHGQSIIQAVEEIILMRNEAMADWRKALHRNVFPQIIWHLDTDETSEISTFKSTVENGIAEREHLYIPKNAVEREVGGVPPNSTLNPLPWIEGLNNYFYEAIIPKIFVGNSRNITDAASKTEYLVGEQIIAEEQLFIMGQVLAQLNLVINLEFPASLQNDSFSSKPKVEERGAEPMEPAAQPKDLKAEMQGGRK